MFLFYERACERASVREGGRAAAGMPLAHPLGRGEHHALDKGPIEHDLSVRKLENGVVELYEAGESISVRLESFIGGMKLATVYFDDQLLPDKKIHSTDPANAHLLRVAKAHFF